MLTDDLKSLGLTEQETTIYLAGVELGPATVLQIARKTGVHRTTVYNTMQSLLEKRLFSESAQGKKRVFVPEGAEAFKAMLRQKMERVDAIAGELSALAGAGSVKPVVKFYSGLEGIKDVFRDATRAKEDILYGIAGLENMNVKSPVLLDFWMNEYAMLRKKHKKFARIIMPDTDGGKLYKATDADKSRETRLVPSSTYNFPAEYMFYDDVVCQLVFSEREQFAVVTRSRALATTMKMIFELCWKQGY